MKLRMDSNNNRNIRIIVMTVLKITHKINYMRERRGGKIHRQRQRQTVRQTNSQEDIQRKKHRRQEKKQRNTEKGKK